MNDKEIITQEEKEGCTMEIFYITSPWCSPCKQQTPIVQELREQYGEEVVITKDISDEENMKWAVDENVHSTPTIIVRYLCPQELSSKGFIDKYFTGFTMKETIINYIEHGK